jgi:hypothetical protein
MVPSRLVVCRLKRQGHDTVEGVWLGLAANRRELGPRRLAKIVEWAKKCNNFRLDSRPVCTAYCMPAGRLRYYLLFAPVHRLLALAVHVYFEVIYTPNPPLPP